jgi:adenylate kinase family enzyme
LLLHDREVEQVERVVVIGSGGAGKSVLARRLAAAWSLPARHLDAVFWGPGWRPTPPDVWRDVVAGLASGDRWVIEGGYPEVLDVVLARAQLAVLLDLPRWATLSRLVLRPLRPRDRGRGDLPRGMHHVVDRENLGWAWHWADRDRPAVLAALNGFSGEVVTLRSPREVRAWLRANAGRRES